MSFDLTRFRDTFFEESLEGLELMESSLLGLDVSDADPEVIDEIFRAAHSIKGGAGTFGFDLIGHTTHRLETVLDEVRDGSRSVTQELVDLLLEGTDCLRDMFSQAMADPDDPAFDVEANAAYVAKLEGALASDAAPTEPTPAAVSEAPEASGDADQGWGLFDDAPTGPEADEGEATSARPLWRIRFRPYLGMLRFGNEPIRMFRQLAHLGEMRAELDTTALPALEEMEPDGCYLTWTLTIQGPLESDEIESVFEWVEDDCDLEITRLDEPEAEEPEASTVAELRSAAPADPVDPVTPSKPATAATPAKPPTPATPAVEHASEIPGAGEATQPVEVPTGVAREEADEPAASRRSTKDPKSLSIRVSIDKIDALVNLVGELVITQSMLTELGQELHLGELEQLQAGLAQLERNTRELQEGVMRVRMVPISHAFHRMPRLVRDLGKQLGKTVEVTMSGETTELDKTVAEKVGDPLVHLVRNSMDHGIEDPQTRLAAGKPEFGTVRLNAYHLGGNIIIEVEDDGRGLNADRILAKAVDRGVVDRDAKLTRTEVLDLVFHPGLSTAEQLSDVSGRGVGMDVVRSNVKGLGGNVTIDSEEGVGTTVRIALPLTLAILDGQLIKVAEQSMVIPLASIVESIQIDPQRINEIPGLGVVYRFRDRYIPIVNLATAFGFGSGAPDEDSGLLVIAEGGGRVAGFRVDELLGQQQIVIKSLESNYQAVPGISGATILGDGRVAMIVDVAGAIQLNGGDHTSATPLRQPAGV